MNTKRDCLKCGAALLMDAPEGICPRCLLNAAAGESVDSESTTIFADGSGLAAPPDRETVIPSGIRYFGDYELMHEIARGGMGVVYKARQTTLNRTVAIKMILTGQLASPEAVRRFRAEAQAAANLQHPNIVAVHEVGEHEGRHYFSMDYVEGQNLSELLGGKPILPRRAAVLLETLADAIHYGHQRGTLHRDLKPQNILIDSFGQPRITDFGLAKRIDEDQSLTHSGAVMGSPSYMSPEQAAGRQDQIGPQSDVYSLGAILYELLTGQVPFRADTAMATLIKVRDEQPARPTRLNLEVPRDLETICLKCLEKKPERRYSSARALAEDLHRFLAREPILARPISAMRRIEFWALHHPWALMLAATLGLVVLLGFTYYLWEQNNFLVWQNTHPEYVKARGPRSADMKRLQGFMVASNVGLMYLWLFYSRRSRHAKWIDLRQPERKGHKVYPVSPVLRQVAYAAGIFGTLFSLYGLTKAIQKAVWEDPGSGVGMFSTSDLYGALALCWVATSLTCNVYRDQHSVQSGEENKARGEAPLNRRGVLSKIIGVGCAGSFLLYLVDFWLAGFHLAGAHLAVQFLAGYTFGAIIFFSRSITLLWLRIALFLGALIITTVYELYSDSHLRSGYLMLYSAALVLGLVLTRKLMEREDRSA